MAWTFALVGTFLRLKATDVFVGVRANEKQEIEANSRSAVNRRYNLELSGVIRNVLRAGIATASCAIAVGVVECGLRAYDAYTLASSGLDSEVSPIFRLTDARYRYELRPGIRRYRGRIDINALGLRGPEIPDVPAPDEFRVLFIGDSVTFAGEVPYEAGFPAKVQQVLRHLPEPRFSATRSLNGGVPGYSPFNELHWLHDKGPLLHADAIVIQFCLNDVVDPLPQWNLTLGYAVSPDIVPEDAIPSPSRHRWVVWFQFLRRFRLARRVESVWARQPTIGGWPAYVTAEQPVSIAVYSNRRAPEIRWLRRTYMTLIAEAKRLTPHVLIVFVPLAYQLVPGYPVHSPQEVMAGIARDNNVPLLDLTPALRELGPVRTYRPGRPGAPDIWHLSEEGHEAAAQAIAATLRAMISAGSES